LDLQNLIEVGNGFFISGAAQDLPTEPWDKLQPKLYEFIWCKSSFFPHFFTVFPIFGGWRAATGVVTCLEFEAVTGFFLIAACILASLLHPTFIWSEKERSQKKKYNVLHGISLKWRQIPPHQFKDNMIKSAVITLWELLTP
jgi:hypothetical protein